MKILNLLFAIVLTGQVLVAQNQSPIPRISQQLTDYFAAYPKEKVYVSTDKTLYKPGETIWIRAFVTDGSNQPLPKDNRGLFVKLCDSKGAVKVQELFKVSDSSAPGDITLPDDLAKGIYFLCAYTPDAISSEEMGVSVINVDPLYKNQWIAETTLKDSISISGQKNEVQAVLRDISGEIQKNSSLHYQLMNGSDVIEKGKLKTDSKGKLVISFALPAKTNGEPFVCQLSDNREEWQNELFLPSDLDPIQIRLFPEGGMLIPGTVAKVGFTAFNKWGIPVDVEGTIQNQEGTIIEPVKTITKGLGFFSIDNANGQRYKLVLPGKSQKDLTFDLPVPNPNGMALSVAKTDAQFISSLLTFADKQKHSIALTVIQGSNLSWAADMEINGTGRIKIPAENIPQGINQLSVFTKEGILLAERIFYIDKKQELKIDIQPEKNSLNAGESMKVKVRLTNENNLPLPANISVSIFDQFRGCVVNPTINENLMIGAELETPFSLISGAFKGKITNSMLMDIYLISNNVKGFNWAKILAFQPEKTEQVKREMDQFLNKNFDAQITGYIADYATKYKLLYKDHVPEANYFANNEDLFQKIPKQVNRSNISLENQRRMLSSGTGIMEVIKTLKPYHLVNNQIVFIGSENSLNYQSGALIVLDGQMMGTDISAISGISPLEVDHINVSTNAMDIQRYTGLNSVGLIEIFQKQAKSKTPDAINDVTNKYDGKYRIPNQFPAIPNNSKRDIRTTLLWIPAQVVDASGQFELTVTAGKVLTNFIIEIQGGTDNGRFGSGQAQFSVVK